MGGVGVGWGAVLHQKTLRDVSRVDEAKRSIWHNYCAHTVIDEHVAWEGFLSTKPHKPISAQSNRLNKAY